MRISDWSSDVCSSDLAARRISGPSGIGQELAAKAAPARDDARSPPLDRIHPPAIHRQTDAVDVGGGRRAQEGDHAAGFLRRREARSEEHTSELQSLMRISYAVFCLKKNKKKQVKKTNISQNRRKKHRKKQREQTTD